MNSDGSPFYRHSGKFGINGLAMAVIGSIAAAFPLGFAYAYLIKWIPIIYLNFLLTAGYGFLSGFLTGRLLRFGKIRNSGMAAVCGMIAGLAALYFAWSAHFYTLIADAPLVLTPQQMWRGIQYLYERGSWSLHSGDAVTGIILAIVWIVEAAIILGLCVMTSFTMVSDTPFCERMECWLEEEKKINTLEAFTSPEHLAAIKAGDLNFLSKVKAKAEGASLFGRLTLKFSSRCEEFFTVTVANVAVSVDNKGGVSEKSQELARNILLPKSMFDHISGLEQLKSEPAPAG